MSADDDRDIPSDIIEDLDEEEGSRAAGLLRYLKDWGVALLLAAALYAFVGWLRAPDLPETAPNFTLTTLAGETVELESLRGQTVVLNFWATWCGPCRTETPTFSAFADEHPEIPVLGIATDGDAETLRAAAEALGITYPVLRADEATAEAYQITTIPTTVVVEPDGSISTVHVGMMFRPQLWWATL